MECGPYEFLCPLLSKVGQSGWEPDLIHFSNTQVFPPVSYYVQQMFSINSGDTYLHFGMNARLESRKIAFSAMRDSKTGDLILKLVNYGGTARRLHFTLPGGYVKAKSARGELLTGDPQTVNESITGPKLVPSTLGFPVKSDFAYEVPSNSLTVIRVHN
jgi:alpha-N-arabinofuranosidase